MLNKLQISKETQRRNASGKQFIMTLLHILWNILILYSFMMFINCFIVQRVVVIGESMEPQFQNGDSLILDRITYQFQKPKRYDTVVIDTDGSYGIIIKRIIGLPGETIYIHKDGSIYVNDVKLEDTYGKETIQSDMRGLAAEKIILSEGEYFIMGDNRNFSADSRTAGIGPVKERNILGRIICKIPFL